MIVINYWAVLLCGVLSMVLGGVWYGPLFGKKWCKIVGATAADMAERKKMQKKAGPLYAIQFILTLFQAYVLAHYIASWQQTSGVENALLLFAGFVVPTVAAGAMWNNDSIKISWAKFLIQTGYYFVLFIIFGLVLGLWP